jgi:hypothetical protein
MHLYARFNIPSFFLHFSLFPIMRPIGEASGEDITCTHIILLLVLWMPIKQLCFLWFCRPMSALSSYGASRPTSAKSSGNWVLPDDKIYLSSLQSFQYILANAFDPFTNASHMSLLPLHTEMETEKCLPKLLLRPSKSCVALDSGTLTSFKLFTFLLAVGKLYR